MKIEELGQKLFETARILATDSSVPCGFEKKVMASVIALPGPCGFIGRQEATFAQLWGGVSTALALVVLSGGIYFFTCNQSSFEETTYDDTTMALSMESAIFSGVTYPPGF